MVNIEQYKEASGQVRELIEMEKILAKDPMSWTQYDLLALRVRTKNLLIKNMNRKIEALKEGIA